MPKVWIEEKYNHNEVSVLGGGTDQDRREIQQKNTLWRALKHTRVHTRVCTHTHMYIYIKMLETSAAASRISGKEKLESFASILRQKGVRGTLLCFDLYGKYDKKSVWLHVGAKANNVNHQI